MVLRRVKKARKQFKRVSRRQYRQFRKHARSTFVVMIFSIAVGAAFGHQLRGQSFAELLQGNKKTEAPSKITSFGPAQSDSQFSTYPTWVQNFERGHGQPDPHYWNIFKGEVQNDNEEAQYYTDNPKNIGISDGSLSLTATYEKQPDGRKYASARIDTEKKRSFLYGRMDVTAKLPKGVGTWPAIWMLPANTKYQDLSPESDRMRYVNGGELDMMEAVGFTPDVVYGVVHTRSDLQKPDQLGAFNQVAVSNDGTGYNLYSMLWTPTSVTYAINNQPYFTYTKTPGADYTTWPFDQPFFLIANLAIGGKWGGEPTPEFPSGIDNSALPASLNIRSIYYYSYIGPR